MIETAGRIIIGLVIVALGMVVAYGAIPNYDAMTTVMILFIIVAYEIVKFGVKVIMEDPR